VGLGLLHTALEAVSPGVVGVRVRGQPWPRGTSDMITPTLGAAPSPNPRFGVRVRVGGSHTWCGYVQG
jgi:hypothetical protein